MNNNQLWQRYCKYLKSYPEVGFSLDISRIRFEESFLDEMRPTLESAFSAMKQLEQGAIANIDENRMVGHYWLRAPELAPNIELTSAIVGGLEQIRAFVAQVHSGDIKPEKKDRFTNVLLIGIGGSALGPQLVSDALWSPEDRVKMFFCDNTDPDGIARTLAQIGGEIDQTLVIVISKSGGTVETRNGFLEAKHRYSESGLNFERHVVAITCADSKLDNITKSEGWLESFHIWDWVGGRTSLFSAVGLLPAALQGVNIDDFLSGAKEMDQLTRADNSDDNPAALMALMWHAAGNGVGQKDMVVIPYKDRLCLFSKYLQQLIMESIGKEKDLDGNVVNQGIAVYGNKGSTDQHAYVQQLRDGLNNFFATFIEVLDDYTEGSTCVSNLEVEDGITSGDYLNGFFQGTRRALYEGGRDSITITIDKLDEKSLGALIALYERTVGLYASLVNINAYHQPGVEAGKKAAERIIALQKKLLAELANKCEEGRTVEELSRVIGEENEAESVYKILEHLASNSGGGRGKVERLNAEGHPESARYR